MKGPGDRLVELFTEAKRRAPGGERERFVAEVCSEDLALRKRLVALLEADEEAGGFLEHNLAGTPVHTEQPGDQIGRYKLLQKLGEGGCGVVYMAEQLEPVRRRVALKIIKLGMDTKQVVARFEAERQALALMDHPNMAKVFDASATATGRPYFVMDLVRGIKITDYCDEHNLSTSERLELFIQICHAVQHAHQKGVIHRDLKPSNILVAQNDTVAVPKIIDFGIAKATAGQILTDKTLFTAFEQFIGTPAYMSPEQAQLSGLDIDTRTDIYSLGVLLYELLTGQTPFEQKELLSAGLDEMRRTIREKDPARPSARLSTMAAQALRTAAKQRQTEAPKLIHLVRGDLDWIVMKCLEKDRARRYETANGLAMDVRRYLKHEPVSARAPSRVDRLQKLVQRNKLTFTLLAVIALALIAIAFGSTLAAWRVARARRAEQRERQKAEAANHEMRATINLLELERAEDFFSAHDGAAGLAHLAGMLRTDPSNSVAATRAISALIHRRWALPVGSPMRHSGPVGMASFSPDGQRALTASSGGTAGLWNAATGQSIAVLQHRDSISAACFSPDGARLVTASTDGTARVWDGVTGAPITPWLRHRGKVNWAEFSSDGQSVLTASTDSAAWIWDPSSGALRQELRVDNGEVALARFSPDGKLVATGTDGDGVRIWSAGSAKTIFRIGDPLERIRALAFSPDGQRLIVAYDNGKALLWDVTTGELAGEPLLHQLPVSHAAFSPDGQWILTTSEDGTARLWEARSTRPFGEPMRHESGVVFGAFSRDGRFVVTSSSDNTARVWEVRTGTPWCQPLRHYERVTHAQFSPDGRRVVTASNDHRAQIWDLREPFDPGIEIVHDANVAACAFSPNGALLLTGASNQTAVLWNSRTGEPLCEPMSHESFPLCGDVGPVGKRVVLGCADGAIQIWDCGQRKTIPAIRAKPRLLARVRHDKAVRCVRFNPGSSQIVSGSADGTARVWDANDGRALSPPLVHGGEILAAQFSHNGRLVVTASADHTARVWEAEGGRPVTEPLAHQDHVHWAEFSPDDESVVTASTDNTACIWSLRTQRPIIAPLQHPRMVKKAIFSPDGRRLATASIDRTARLWETATGHALTPPLYHDSFVEEVFFTSDSRGLVTVSRSGLARLWDCGTGQPLTEWLQAGKYWGACFNPENRKIAVGTAEGVVRIWDLPRAAVPVPPWFPGFAEAIAGMRLGERGTIELLDVRGASRFARDFSESSGVYGTVAKSLLAGPER